MYLLGQLQGFIVFRHVHGNTINQTLKLIEFLAEYIGVDVGGNEHQLVEDASVAVAIGQADEGLDDSSGAKAVGNDIDFSITCGGGNLFKKSGDMRNGPDQIGFVPGVFQHTAVGRPAEKQQSVLEPERPLEQSAAAAAFFKIDIVAVNIDDQVAILGSR